MTAPVDEKDRPRCPVATSTYRPGHLRDGLPARRVRRDARRGAGLLARPAGLAAATASGSSRGYADVQEVSRTPEVFSSYERGALLHTGDSAQDEEEALQMTRMLMLNMDPPEHSHYRNIVQRAFTPAHDPQPRAAAQGVRQRDRRPGAGQGRGRLRQGRRRRAAAARHLRADRRPGRGPRQDLRPVQPPHRLRRPGVPHLAGRRADRLGRDVHVRRRPRRGAQGVPAWRTSRPSCCRPTSTARRSPQEQFDVFFLLLIGRRQRDDPQRDHARHAGLLRPPRPVGAVQEGAPARHRGRGDHPLGARRSCSSSAPRCRTTSSAASRSRRATGSPSTTRPPTATRRRCDSPDAFDITREDNEHVAFGGGGPHFCLGANLARAEVRIMFDVIADRMPDIAPARRRRACCARCSSTASRRSRSATLTGPARPRAHVVPHTPATRGACRERRSASGTSPPTHPDRVALVEPDHTEHTAGELLGACNQVVHGLRALGVQTGDVVAMLLPNGAAFLEVLLAVQQAGLLRRADQLPPRSAPRSPTSSTTPRRRRSSRTSASPPRRPGRRARSACPTRRCSPSATSRASAPTPSSRTASRRRCPRTGPPAGS